MFLTETGVTIRIASTRGMGLPVQASSGAAGLDVSAALEGPLVIEPLGRALIPTGLYLEIPYGHEVQLRPRSGLALRHGVTLLNSPATIDSDYRGELRVLLVNLSQEPFTVTHGMRIAQLMAARVLPLNWQAVESPEDLSATDRGHGGFGHTGLGA